MSLKRAFSKIGKGIFGAMKSKVTRRVAAEVVRTTVPVYGPAIARAIDVVEAAEILFDEPRAGKKKRQWAVEQLSAQLRELGIEEKRLLGLIELALLLTKGEATIDWDDDAEQR